MGSHSGIIEELTADHRRIQQLFDRIRSAPPGSDERMALVEQTSKTVVRHGVAEKEHLYPLVRRYVDDGDTRADRALAGQREIEDLLAALEAREPSDSDTTEEFTGTLLSVINRLTDHIVQQEQRLFPQLQANCPPDVLQDLGTEARDAEASAPTRPRPQAPQSPRLVKLTARAWGPWDRLRDRVTQRGRK